MKAKKTYRIIKRNGKWVPAIISLVSGRVLKLYKDLSDKDRDTVKLYLQGIKNVSPKPE